MERRDPPRWTSAWPAGLLAASILSSSFLLTQAQQPTTVYNISVFMDPPEALEGQKINLTLTHAPAEFFLCNWYRGTEVKENLIVTIYLPPLTGNTFGSAYTNREIPGFGCSLLITNLHPNDSGNYTVTKDGAGVHGRGLANIQVLEKLSNPDLWSSAFLVAENGTVTLSCNTSSSTRVTVTWSKDGRPVPAKARLSDQNRTLTLLKFAPEDAGNYTCMASNPVSSATSNPRTITMAYGPTAAKLNQSGTIVQPLGSTLVLLCTADSVPPAEFEWFFNTTAKNGTEDTLSVRLETWEDEGSYMCQARNSFTHHNASASLYVKLTGSGSGLPGLSAGTIAGIVIGSVSGAVLCVGVMYFLFTKASCWVKKTYNIQH
ncbi:carcinoembryonic antigen-related cell adhesion molecule 6-like isoform X2 [Candoia aspera]|uniref:carcinoembryonic antigen-related cell adhesion molecule 6-like isoform X2 n=1 Tax=Candoia aspera TaxID=51853 RepID=UPI002FD7F357